MPDRLSVAIGAVLSMLETAESKYGFIDNTHLVSLQDTPTNIIEFTIDGHEFEVMVNEKMRLPAPRVKPSLHRVKLSVKDNTRDIDRTTESV